MNTFQVKSKICYGKNAIEEIRNQDFERVCIATDQFMVKFGLLKKLTDILDELGIEYHVFSDIESDPSMDVVKAGLGHIMKLRPDALIALGGGSVIDAAKAIIYFCIHFKREFVEEEYIKKPCFIAMPTTAGTGSEVTEYSVITDKEANAKVPLTDPLMLPDIAILEPSFTTSVPKSVTAATGMDVLTHAIEAYISKGANPFSASYALEAIDITCRSLVDCCETPENLEARANMQVASCMAGIAFNSAGLGITHSIAHAIGAEFHLPHGLANAIVLPYVLKFNGQSDQVKRKYAVAVSRIGVALSLDGRVNLMVNAIKNLKEDIGIPSCLSDILDISDKTFKSKLPCMVDKAFADVCTQTNPVEVTKEDLVTLFCQVYYGTELPE
jgi:alcohol dehydrogenase class IV